MSQVLAREPRLVRLQAAGLLSATVLISVNMWTGAPLLALWVGSRVVGQQSLSMGAVFAVLVVLGVLVAAMATALTWLSDRYDRLTGRRVSARRISPWLRSMRGDRDDLGRDREAASAVETIVIASTVAAVVAFEIWFFFIAGSPLPG